MDEQEFRRVLQLFPVVRSRDYIAESDSLIDNTSYCLQDEAVKEWQDAWDDGDKTEIPDQEMESYDPFWKNLKVAVEKKVGAAEAERFCKVFLKVHRKLVSEELSLDAARRLFKASKNAQAIAHG